MRGYTGAWIRLDSDTQTRKGQFPFSLYRVTGLEFEDADYLRRKPARGLTGTGAGRLVLPLG